MLTSRKSQILHNEIEEYRKQFFANDICHLSRAVSMMQAPANCLGVNGTNSTTKILPLVVLILFASGCSLESKIKRISKAIENIDPLGVKAQIAKNDELKAKLEAATLKLSGTLTGSGGMEISSGQKIQLQLREVVGHFIVKAWIDDRTPVKQIFQDELRDSDRLDNWKFDKSLAKIHATHCNCGSIPVRPGIIVKSKNGTFASEVNNLYRKDLQAKLGRLTVHDPGNSYIDLDVNLGSLNSYHMLYVDILPVASDSSVWRIRGEVVLLNAEGKEIRRSRSFLSTSEHFEGNMVKEKSYQGPYIKFMQSELVVNETRTGN